MPFIVKLHTENEIILPGNKITPSVNQFIASAYSIRIVWHTSAFVQQNRKIPEESDFRKSS